VRVLVKRVRENHGAGNVIETMVTGYTTATITTNDSEKIILYAHPCFQGNPRYDWAYVHFQEIAADGIEVENHYPSRILGFIEIDGGITEAVIQSTEKPLLWSEVESDFFSGVGIDKSDELSIVTVPISALVHPLCVFPESFGSDETYIVVLLKRNWSCYFGNKIN
jgi:hypothetical protein